MIKLKLVREPRQTSFSMGPFMSTPSMAWRDSDVFEDGNQGPFMAYHDLYLPFGGRYVTLKDEESLAILSENINGERESMAEGIRPVGVRLCGWGECPGHRMSRAEFIKRYCGGVKPPQLEG